MYDEWIKVRHVLFSCPQIVRVMSELKRTHLEVFGGTVRAFMLADLHAVEIGDRGLLSDYTPEALDLMVGMEGWTRAAEGAKWVSVAPEGIFFEEWGKHNGSSAKRRSVDRTRKRLGRSADNARTSSGQLSDATRTPSVSVSVSPKRGGVGERNGSAGVSGGESAEAESESGVSEGSGRSGEALPAGWGSGAFDPDVQVLYRRLRGWRQEFDPRYPPGWVLREIKAMCETLRQIADARTCWRLVEMPGCTPDRVEHVRQTLDRADGKLNNPTAYLVAQIRDEAPCEPAIDRNARCRNLDVQMVNEWTATGGKPKDPEVRQWRDLLEDRRKRKLTTAPPDGGEDPLDAIARIEAQA